VTDWVVTLGEMFAATIRLPEIGTLFGIDPLVAISAVAPATRPGLLPSAAGLARPAAIAAAPAHALAAASLVSTGSRPSSWSSRSLNRSVSASRISAALASVCFFVPPLSVWVASWLFISA
jgi:hypothetical protein